MATVELTSRIESVTVYRRCARVQRVAELALPSPPPEVVRVAGLPLVADDGSFRVRCEAIDGTSGAPPVARDLRVALDAHTSSAGRPPDEAELAQARLEQARLETRLELVLAELKRVSSLEVPERPSGPEGEPPPASPVEARLALLAFISQRSEALTAERGEIEPQLERARRRREELEDRKRRASDDRPPEMHALRKTAVVRLDPPSGERPAERARLVVEYEVPGTRWAPAYALHLDGDGGRAELRLSGVVAQRTGEDWSGVQLTLSTADARRHRELPLLASLRIGRRQRRRPPIGWREPPEGAEALYADWDRAFVGRGSAARPAPAPEPEPELVPLLQAEPSIGDDDDLDLGAEVFGTAMALDAESIPASAPAPPPAPMPAPSPAAAPAPRARFLGARAARGAAPGRVAPRATPPEEPITAREDLLEFAALRMPAPGSPDRGHLVARTRLQLYVEVEELVSVPPPSIHISLERSEREAGEAGRGLARSLTPVDDLDGEDAVFRAEDPVDVPSDERAHSVPLLSRSLEAELSHVCVPRESLDVYQLVGFANPLPGPLLPGPIDVYSGGGFLLTGRLPATPRSARVELGLGIDAAVRASRNTRYHEDARGLTGGRLELDHGIEIEVRNNRPRPIRLEVRERLPVAPEKHPDVQVEPGEVSPEWEDWAPVPRGGERELRGGHRWRLDLPAGEVAQLKAAYRVRISSKHELVGGNRREL